MRRLGERGRGLARVESLATRDLPCGRTLKKIIIMIMGLESVSASEDVIGALPSPINS